MNESVTYRIVGAIVLMALAVIFVPMLLDGSGRKEVTTVNIDTPPAPKYVFSKPVDSSQLPGNSAVQEEKSTSNNTADTAEADTTEDIVEAITVAENTPNELRGWVVQVAALSNKETAKTLRDKLVKEQFDAFVERVENNSKPIYRVKVGPVLTEKQAESLLSKIEKQAGVKNLLIKRHPEKSGESS